MKAFTIPLWISVATTEASSYTLRRSTGQMDRQHFPRQQPADVVSTLRGGGGSLRESALVAYTAMIGSHGIVSLAAPEVSARKFYGTFNLNADNVAQMAMELAGASMFGTVVMAYLSTQTQLAVTDIIAFGSFPRIYAHFRRQFKDSFVKFGFTKGVGTLMALVPTYFTYMILFGTQNVYRIAQIHVYLPLLMGILGIVAPGISNQSFGLPRQQGIPSAMFRLMSSALVQWGILALALLNGYQPYRAIGFSAAYLAFDLLEANFIRKHNVGLNLPPNHPAIFCAIMTSIAYGLLQRDSKR